MWGQGEGRCGYKGQYEVMEFYCGNGIVLYFVSGDSYRSYIVGKSVWNYNIYRDILIYI